MDDFGNDIMEFYTPSKDNNFMPPEFNWTAYVYFYRPDLVKIVW